ncbi:MAG: hypothetical protein HY926_05220 [Elusimicrobia bacterium]|nr:hypothetical protein [Elusimicrobiota bacterium]
MSIHRGLTTLAFVTALLGAVGCGANATLRYGRDGQPEYFIECSKKPMASCYEAALKQCPQGYFLVEESQTPGGTKSGSIFGGGKNVGGQAGSSEITWKNQLVVRCKPAGAAPAPAAP